MRRAVSRTRHDLAFWVYNSEAFVSAEILGGRLDRIHIEFHGEASRIPSLKNSKLPGKNFLNPETLNRLKAMDALYWRSASVYNRKHLTFGAEPVVGLLVMGRRKVRFDLDNCAAAIKDWLEPPTIRNRGWGVGLVENDANVTIFPVHSAQMGRVTEFSTLILQPWSSIGASFRAWADRAFY